MAETHTGKAGTEHTLEHCRPRWCGQFPGEGHPLAATPEEQHLLDQGKDPIDVYIGAYDARLGQPRRSPEVKTLSRAEIAARVIREHEPRPMGCSCGAPMGDDIDYRWHLVNQTIAAMAARAE